MYIHYIPLELTATEVGCKHTITQHENFMWPFHEHLLSVTSYEIYVDEPQDLFYNTCFQLFSATIKIIQLIYFDSSI